MGQRYPEVFSEGNNVETLYCSGIAFVSIDGPNLILALYQKKFAYDGGVDKVIVTNIAIPREAWLTGRDLAEFEIASAGHAVARSGVELPARA